MLNGFCITLPTTSATMWICVAYEDRDVKRFCLCVLTTFFIYGCDNGSDSTVKDNSAQAIKIFQKQMDENNNVSKFKYSNMRFIPDADNSNETVSGWVCGDAEMTHSQGTFELKVRGHIIESSSVSHAGDLAALPLKSGLVEHDVLYNKHCK